MKNKTRLPIPKRYVVGCILIGLVLVGFGVFAGRALVPPYMSLEYLRRVITSGESQTTDWHRIFPKRDIRNDSAAISILNSDQDYALADLSSITYHRDGREASIGPDIQKFLTSTKTDSFLIIKNDAIVYETYLSGTDGGTVRTSMSAAKSFISALTGIAIHEGYIKSIDETVVRYLPELRGKISGKMTIKHLLTMTAGNTYNGSGGLSGDDTKTYWSPELRDIVLDYFRSSEEPGKHVHYNDFQPQVLGMILERATGVSISEYMQAKIWQPAGMEHDASWSLDSKKSGFEQAAVGVNAVSRDFARFGLIYLHKGKWNNQQIIPGSWVADSTYMTQRNKDEFLGWHDSDSYGYYWWGNKVNDGTYDYYARGKHGQFIYVSPASDTVIVRTGSSTGQVQDWPEIFEKITRAWSP